MKAAVIMRKKELRQKKTRVPKLHKLKRPCICGHKAGKHGIAIRQSRFTKPTRGSCSVNNCGCKRFRERPNIIARAL